MEEGVDFQAQHQIQDKYPQCLELKGKLYSWLRQDSLQDALRTKNPRKRTYGKTALKHKPLVLLERRDVGQLISQDPHLLARQHEDHHWQSKANDGSRDTRKLLEAITNLEDANIASSDADGHKDRMIYFNDYF